MHGTGYCSGSARDRRRKVTKDQRRWTAEQKLQAVMAVLRGEMSLAEQARRLKVNENQLYRWRDQASQALLSAFTDPGPTGHERQLEDRVAELERLCGKQAVMIEVLKKTRVV
jgi:transposase-like protein